jgi:hypothetical protein
VVLAAMSADDSVVLAPMKRYRIGTEIVEGYQLTGDMALDDTSLRPFDIGLT